MYNENDVFQEILKYFEGDELAANVWVSKYALRDKSGSLLEKTPEDMHRRLSSEFARIENSFGGKGKLSEELIFSLLDRFKYIVPQGSPMYGIGNNQRLVSLSNCVVVDSPEDDMSSIMESAKELANLYKRRCVAADSNVVTDKGLKRIKDINIGDMVLSYNTKTRSSEFKKVLDKFYTEVKPEDRLVLNLSDGTILRTSKKHPVLVFNTKSNSYDYVEAGKIKIGDVLIRPEQKNLVSGFNENLADIGWFIGCHMGDGSCDIVKRSYNEDYKEVRFRCAGDNEDVVAKYTEVFNDISGSKANYHISSRKDYAVSVWEYSNQNNGNFDLASKYLNGQVGSKTYSGAVPSYVIENNLYIPFIAGLVDADGWIKDGSIVISICAKEIIDHLSSWLSSHGIRCHVGSYKNNNRIKESETYRLTIYKNQNIITNISKFMVNKDKRNAILNAGSKVHSHMYSLSSDEIDGLIENYKSNYNNKVGGDNVAAITSNLKRFRRGAGEAALIAYYNAGLMSEDKLKEIRQRVVVKGISSDLQTSEYIDIEVQDNNNFYSGNYGLVNIHNCGVGVDISNLRPDGAPVNNSAMSSTGAWSFADLYSYVTRMVGQSGRRGALMITIDVRHPDIEKFITMKHDLTKVTGANVSVRFTDDFMNAVVADEDFELRWPCESKDPQITRKVRAKEVWDLICNSATKTAEPGLMMWDNITSTLPAHCYPDYKTLTTNPCGEIPLSANDSCRLISQNLKHYVVNPFTEEAYFDFDLFKEHARYTMRLCDDLAELELEKLKQIIDSCDSPDEKRLFEKLHAACENGRRTGSGTHGLADALSRLCLRYDSKEAIELTEKIYEVRKIESYRESINLAEERGAFPVFNWDLEKDNVFIQSLPKKLLNRMAKIGRRNISILTNAPTGSVSIESQTSSGLEPVFRHTYTRRKKINPGEKDARVDFVDDLGDKWQEFTVYHQNAKEYLEMFPKKKNLPDFFVDSENINWPKRVDIQAAIQRHVDHSISSTINLPAGTSPEVVSELYLEGWKQGLKGLTVYVDGSRSGVLVTNSSKEEDDNTFDYRDAVKRPDELTCDIHSVKVKGEHWTILVGLIDGKPYEVFGGLSEMIEIPKKYTEGVLIKAVRSKNKSRYDLRFGEDGLIKNVTKVFDNPTYQVHTRMVSLALRHGAKPSFLVEQLQKDPDNDLTSFSKVLARVLKKYIEDGTKVAATDKTCPACGAENSLVYQEGCVSCESCGWTKCL